MKRITQIDPSSRTDLEAADRHYETVHSPFARESFLREAPAMLRYGWNRVRGEYDLGGRFRQRPSAWRFVISEWTVPATSDGGSAQPASTPGVPPRLLDRLVGDHLHFMRHMRPYDVAESVFFDARSGQLSLSKFVFLVAAAPAGSARPHEELLRLLAEHLAAAQGARLGLDNRVLRQAVTLPIAEPGQRYGEGFLAEPSLSHILEFYFDNHDAGEEFFVDSAVRELLTHPEVGRICGYAVDEWIGFDRR